jgi:bacillithiol system protein YtxJ
MEFKTLNNINQLEVIDKDSKTKIQVIFKHSTTCSVSFFANKNLLREMKDLDNQTFEIYYLDLITYRAISNTIASHYQVTHESPQLLFIKDGVCIYDASHSEVSLISGLEEVA